MRGRPKKIVTDGETALVKATRELEDLIEQATVNDKAVEECYDRQRANAIERDMVARHLDQKLLTLRRQRRVIDAMLDNAKEIVSDLRPTPVDTVLGGCFPGNRLSASECKPPYSRR